MDFQSNDKMYVAIGLSWSVLIAVCISYVPTDDNGIKHVDWWRDYLAILPIFTGVLFPLYAREILGRVRFVCHTIKHVGKPTYD